MTNSADPDLLASSGSTLFAKTGHVMFSKRRVNVMLHSIFSFLFSFSFLLNKLTKFHSVFSDDFEKKYHSE